MFEIAYILLLITTPYGDPRPHCGGYYYPPLTGDTYNQTQDLNANTPSILYLNFEGATIIRGGGDDPVNNTSWIPDYASVEIPPFNAEGLIRAPLIARQDVIDAITGWVRFHYALYNIIIVTERPPDDVPYQMMMVGGSANLITPNPGGMVGISPFDCNNISQSDVSFTFSDDLSSIEDIATTITHEAGHSFGLAHVDDNKAVMNPYVTPDPSWQKGDVPDGQACDNSTYQDSALVLSQNLDSINDNEPPWVDFLNPGNGAKVPLPFVVNLVTGDLIGLGKYVDLFIDGEKYASKIWPYFSFTINNLTEGNHQLKAIVTDEAGNSSSTKITINVSYDCAQSDSCKAGIAGIGESCKTENSCNIGICALSNTIDDAWCSVECIPNTSSCAFGMKCLPTEDESTYYCAYGEGTVTPKTNSDAHRLGCNSSKNTKSTIPLWLTFLSIFIVWRYFKFKNSLHKNKAL